MAKPMKKPRARQIFDANELLLTYRIMEKSPAYDNKDKFLNWLEGCLKMSGYIRVGEKFYKSSDVSKLPPL